MIQRFFFSTLRAGCFGFSMFLHTEFPNNMIVLLLVLMIYIFPKQHQRYISILNVVDHFNISGIYKRSLQPIPDIPDPDGYGWMMEEELAIDWMTLPPAPDSVMELANCTGSCKKTRCSDETTCTCLQNNIPCTDLCKCGRNDCSNITGHVDFDDKNDDKDSRSEAEEDSDAEEDEITARFV